jgi:phosphatidylglycerophosphatase C
MDIAFFDFDGTITDRDAFSLFIKRHLPWHKMLVAVVVLPFLILFYKQGWLTGEALRRFAVLQAFKHQPVHAFDTDAKFFALQVIPPLVRPWSAQQLAWHQQQGNRIVVVSAGLNLYLQHWCATNGYLLIASDLEVSLGSYTGRFESNQSCAGEQKALRILQQFNLQDYEQVYAYGDTPEDFAMLDLADVQYYCGKLRA